MEPKTTRVNTEDLTQLKRDVTMIKNILIHAKHEDDEGELTEWAKGELEEARKVPDSELLSSEEVRQVILDA